MTILPARLAAAGVLALASGTLALAVSGCRAQPSTVRGTFSADGVPSVDVTIAIQSAHQREADRYLHGAFTTLGTLGTWLAPFPAATLSVTAESTRWWTAPASMAPEFAVARAVSRQYWERVMDTRALPAPFVAALSEYTARRAVSKIVDERYYAVYRSRAEGRYFGGFVPRDLRVQLRVEDEGDPIGDDEAVGRALLTLGTLERWVGRDAFDVIVREFVVAFTGKAPALDDFSAVASRVSGQNLAWLVGGMLTQSGPLDYSVSAFDSQPESGGTFKTTVTVRRWTGAIFGRAVPVETTFADGTSIRDAWDGRAERTFAYRSPARAVSAEVDPDRVLLLDRNRGNNGITLDTGPANTAATRWSARWMIWLEDALLTYVAFT